MHSLPAPLLRELTSENPWESWWTLPVKLAASCCDACLQGLTTRSCCKVNFMWAQSMSACAVMHTTSFWMSLSLLLSAGDSLALPSR